MAIRCEHNHDLKVSLSQALKPTHPNHDSSGPAKVDGGSWAFEIDKTNPDTLKMVVTVTLTVGMKINIELHSRLTAEDVRQLQKWLTHYFGPPAQ